VYMLYGVFAPRGYLCFSFGVVLIVEGSVKAVLLLKLLSTLGSYSLL